jgi:eukaryotic-like serine/threonine-protein kinase
MKPVKNVMLATVVNDVQSVPRPGQLIGDRYRLDCPLERGAMGSVWRAEQVRLRAPVAVKFLDPSLIGDKEMHDRFMQEARSAAAVRSAHVVQVFDYGSEGGVPYIAMELLDGENLDARLGRGPLSPAELARLFSELARGIGQAHAIGVIHRDLKPGNIFIAREGEHEVTKIVDFGIAKVKASALRMTRGIGTQLGTLLGTPQYMSPEQVRGSASIDHRTDLWALGVIACECLTGRCPFSGATLGDLTVQICTEKPPAPSSFGPVPPGFDQWFFKAVQKKPAKRFQSAEEMADRLFGVLAPACNGALGTARGNRLISLPSRSEVRLAYSAVVTWKGELSIRLEQAWSALRNALVRLGAWLERQYDDARVALASRSGGERFAALRPLLERHGLLASVALLCSAMLLLGLTSRNSDPEVVVTPLRTDPAPVLLGAVATQAPSPSPTPTTERGALTAPASSAEPVAAPATSAAAPAPAAALDPTPALVARQPVASASIRPSAARSAEPPAATAPAEHRAEKPITMAMAQAAAKILTADELVASVPAARAPAAKAAPRSVATPAPKAVEPAPKSAPEPKAAAGADAKTSPATNKAAAPSAPSKRGRSPERSRVNPFDDRL